MPVYIKGLYEVCEQKIHEAMYDLLDLFTILEADSLKSRVKRGSKIGIFKCFMNCTELTQQLFHSRCM